MTAFVPPSDWDFNPFEDFRFTYEDVAIGGKLVRGTIRVPEHKIMAMGPHTKDYFRTTMATQLAEYMISAGLLEFTQMTDNVTLDRIVNVRCYLAPNEQVKILRLSKNVY